MFLYILLGLFLTVTCIKPKLCINCKYYTNKSDLKSNIIYGKCLLSPKNNDNDINFLVTGEKILNIIIAQFQEIQKICVVKMVNYIYENILKMKIKMTNKLKVLFIYIIF